MIEVVVKHKTSHEISQIVSELKDLGYRVHIDFDFEYSAGKFDWSTVVDVPRQTKFIFYNESMASWFALKYN